MRASTEGSIWRRLFADHPSSVRESYSQHFLAASRIGFRLVGMGIACMCHAVIPAMFQDVASQRVSELAGEIAQRRGSPQ